MEEKALDASSWNKRCYSQRCNLQVSLLLLAALGGEGEEQVISLLIAAGWCPAYLACPGQDSALVAAISKRCCKFITTISGQEVGLAALDISSDASFSFLRK
jgi:hypothetical protein